MACWRSSGWPASCSGVRSGSSAPGSATWPLPIWRSGSWPVPPLFQLVREVATQLDTYELYRTLNMGIGMVAVCAAADLDAVQRCIDEPTWVIGEVVPTRSSTHRVHLQ